MLLEVDHVSFLVIVLMAAVAGTLSGLIQPRLIVPVVVLEVVIGIIVGPQVLDLVVSDSFTEFFRDLGLAMLFFFAGYEIDFERLRGLPLRLGAGGWVLSLALAYGIGAVLIALGIGGSLVFLGAAMATTAIGTLIPILGDAGEMETRFGRFLLGAGAVGEFGPILIVTLLFSSTTTLEAGALLILFVLLAVVGAAIAMGSVGKGWNLIERTLHSSSQLPIRVIVVIIFGLVALAAELGIDLLLGGFVAGIIVSLALRDREVEALDSKLEAIGYGFLIPFFFIVTGVEFDLDSLTDDPIRLLELPLFLAIFLVVRGLPAMLLYRRVLDLRDRYALAVFSATQLPLVVAITTIAVSKDEMASGTAAALVGAAVLSTAILPITGLRLRGNVLPDPLRREAPR